MQNADGAVLVNNGTVNDVDTSLADVNELGSVQEDTPSELPKDNASIPGSVIVPRDIVQPETVPDIAEPFDVGNNVECYRIDVDNRVERERQQIRYLLTRLSLLRTGMIKETYADCSRTNTRYDRN